MGRLVLSARYYIGQRIYKAPSGAFIIPLTYIGFEMDHVAVFTDAGYLFAQGSKEV